MTEKAKTAEQTNKVSGNDIKPARTELKALWLCRSITIQGGRTLDAVWPGQRGTETYFMKCFLEGTSANQTVVITEDRGSVDRQSEGFMIRVPMTNVAAYEIGTPKTSQ